MDAPPEQEDLGSYLRVSELLEQCGMHVPHVFAADTTQGYAVLEDLGSTHMLTALDSGMAAARLYGDALDALAHLQLTGGSAAQQLPPYDRATLLRENAAAARLVLPCITCSSSPTPPGCGILQGDIRTAGDLRLGAAAGVRAS